MTEKDNTGFLFANRRKAKPTHKDYEGHCNIDGKQYWISAWVKEGEKSGKYLSMAFDAREITDLGDME